MQINNVCNNQSFGAQPFWPVMEMCKRIKKNNPEVAKKMLNKWNTLFPEHMVAFHQRSPRLIERRLMKNSFSTMEDIYINTKKVASIPNVKYTEGNEAVRLKRILTKLKLIEAGKDESGKAIRKAKFNF